MPDINEEINLNNSNDNDEDSDDEFASDNFGEKKVMKKFEIQSMEPSEKLISRKSQNNMKFESNLASFDLVCSSS